MNDNMTIAENISSIRERMARATALAGTPERSVILVGATKMNESARVREAVEAGIDAVGENRVQELLAKNEQGAYLSVPLHFIGHLQRNKVKDIVGITQLIQSVDSEELLKEISKRAAAMGIVQNVLLEVNIGREEAKSGVLPEKLDELAAFTTGLAGVKVSGLMAVQPAEASRSHVFTYFEEMYKLYVDIKQKRYDNVVMGSLSMGMSTDFEDAIRCGANMIRVGSEIFGARSYPEKK